MISFFTGLVAVLQATSATPAPTEEALTPPEARELASQPIVGKSIAFPELDDAALYARVKSALNDVGSMKARFEQIAPSGTVTTGDLYLDRPGRLRFDYDDPNPQLIVATGGIVYVHDADLETTDTYPVRSTPLRFLLSREIDDAAGAVADIYREPDRIAVVLESTDDEVQGELVMIFSAPELQLTEWSVFEPSGAITSVALSDVETDVRLQGRLFRAPDAGGAFLRD